MKYLIFFFVIFCQLFSYSQSMDLTTEYIKNITKLTGEPKAQAIVDLGKLSDPRAIMQLSAYAKDPTDSAIRIAAINAVQWIRVPDSYSIALEALTDPTDNVKLAAIQSLSVITNELHGWIYPGNEATASIIKLFNNSKEKSIRIAAFSYLITKNEPVVNEIVINATNDTTQEIRIMAISSPIIQQNYEKITSLISDNNSDIKSSVAICAGKLKSAKGLNILKLLINDKSSQVKTAVLQAMANYKDDDVKAIIMPLQTDKDLIVASQAILTAAESGYADYQQLSERYQTEKQLPIKMAIINAMQYAPAETATEILLKILQTVKVDFADNFIPSLQIITAILSEKCNKISPALMELSKSKDAEIRASLAIILKNFKNPESIMALNSLSNDDEIPVRICAINSLSTINNTETHGILLALLNDRVPSVKIAAIRGLAQCKLKQANEKVLKLIADDNTSVAIEAVIALGIINSNSNAITGNLLNYYQKSSMPIQTAIIYTLGNTGDNRISIYLHELFNDAPKEMKIAIIYACGKIKDEWIITKIAEMMNGISQYDIDIKKAAAESLSNFDNDDSLRLLNNNFVYNNIPVVRNSAIWSLSNKTGNNPKSILANIILNLKADFSDRSAAIMALNSTKDETAIKICKEIVKAEQNPQIKLAALTVLVNNNEVTKLFITDWITQCTNPELISILSELRSKIK